jgi:predicted nucleic acid-binding protein
MLARDRFRGHYVQLRDALDAAFGDLVIHPVDAEIVRTARVIEPPVLRSLDALHLATAVLIGAEVVVTYDERLAESAAAVGLTPVAPGR